jgi:predicted amidohydrolase YtcJ
LDSPPSFVPIAYHFQQAVTRKTEPGQDIGPEQKVTGKEAIRAYTLAGAYARFEGNIKGSIEAGKLADLVVLSDNIFRVAPKKIKDLNADLTMMDSQLRYLKMLPDGPGDLSSSLYKFSLLYMDKNNFHEGGRGYYDSFES